MRRAFLSILLCLCSTPCFAAFTHYKAVTIQAAKVPSSQSGFPALLPFVAGDADFAVTGSGGKSQSSGNDIRPYSNSDCVTGPLTYELVPGTYVTTTGAFEMWVNITAANGAIVYVCVGQAGMPDGSSAATWDANFKGVWHLGNGSSLSGADSTGANNAANLHATAAGAGTIDGGASYDGTNNWIELAGNPLSGKTQFTIACWIKPVDIGVGTMFGQFSGTNNSILFRIRTAIQIFYQDDSNNQYGGTIGLNATAPATWQMVHATFDAHTLEGYSNGSVGGTTYSTTAAVRTNTTYASIGGADRGGAGTEDKWNGILDEVRVSDIARSADWITTEYNNQSNLGTFWSKGSITAVSAGTTGPLAGSTAQTGAGR